MFGAFGALIIANPFFAIISAVALLSAALLVIPDILRSIFGDGFDTFRQSALAGLEGVYDAFRFLVVFIERSVRTIIGAISTIIRVVPATIQRTFEGLRRAFLRTILFINSEFSNFISSFYRAYQTIQRLLGNEVADYEQSGLGRYFTRVTDSLMDAINESSDASDMIVANLNQGIDEDRVFGASSFYDEILPENLPFDEITNGFRDLGDRAAQAFTDAFNPRIEPEAPRAALTAIQDAIPETITVEIEYTELQQSLQDGFEGASTDFIQGILQGSGDAFRNLGNALNDAATRSISENITGNLFDDLFPETEVQGNTRAIQLNTDALNALNNQFGTSITNEGLRDTGERLVLTVDDMGIQRVIDPLLISTQDLITTLQDPSVGLQREELNPATRLTPAGLMNLGLTADQVTINAEEAAGVSPVDSAASLVRLDDMGEILQTLGAEGARQEASESEAASQAGIFRESFNILIEGITAPFEFLGGLLTSSNSATMANTVAMQTAMATTATNTIANTASANATMLNATATSSNTSATATNTSALNTNTSSNATSGAGGAGFLSGLSSFTTGLGTLVAGVSIIQQLRQFQQGGSFRVGGAGGIDSQLVAFRASPNEQVTVETPEQQRRRAREGSGDGGQINIQNVFTPSDIISAFNSNEGGQFVVNQISRNIRQVNGVLGSR